MASKTELLRFLDARVFNPILKASPGSYKESERKALEDVQSSTKSEKQRFHAYRNAQEAIDNYKSDLHSETAKRINAELKRLKLPSLPSVRREFLEMAEPKAQAKRQTRPKTRTGPTRIGYSTTRSSPSRRVTRSRSRYSSSGMAYLREMPVQSLNAGTLKRAGLRAASMLAQAGDGGVVEDQVFAHAHQPLFANQDLEQRAGARRFHAGFGEHLAHRRHGQPGLLEGALDGRLRLLLVLLEHQPVRAQAHGLALGDEVARVRQQRVQQEGAAACRAAPAWECRAAAGSSGGTRARRARARSRADCHHAVIRQPRLRLLQQHEARRRRPRLRFRARASRCAPPARRSSCRAAIPVTSSAIAARGVRRCQRVQALRHVGSLAVAHAAGVHHRAAADGDDRAKTCG